MAKQGKSITELAAELQRQAASRRDFLAPTAQIAVAWGGEKEPALHGAFFMDGLPEPNMRIGELGHDQIQGHYRIPREYYQRMQAEQPALLAANVNTWMHAKAEKRMVRTLDGKVRAFLSNKYRPLDNVELAETALPVLLERGVQIISTEVTERRMYLKGILPELSTVLKGGQQYGVGHQRIEGNAQVAAIEISNSEVGAGSLSVRAGVFTTWCTNLAIFSDAGMKKYHVGRARGLDELESAYEVFTDETRRQDDRAFWMKVRDVLGAAFDKDVFAARVEVMNRATENQIVTNDFGAVVELTTGRLGLPKATNEGILAHLVRGGDLTQWGLAAAITRAAQDVESYDLATDMERGGGKVIELAKNEWEVLATAKKAA